MVLLWIVGILAALILLICLLRVGAEAAYDDSTLAVDVRIAFVRLRILPKTEAKKEPAPKEAEEKKTTEKEAPEKKKKPAPADLLDAAKTLWPALKKALEKTRRGIRIDPLTASVTVAGSNDPAEAAQLYGRLHAAVWGGMPVLEQLLVIPDPKIHIGIDFDASEPQLSGKLGISARAGTLLGIGLTMAIPALKWYLNYRKKKKPQPEAAAEKKAA